MVATRKSIYIPDHLVGVLDVHEDQGESLSARVAAVLDRYAHIMRHHTVAFTRHEWCMIMDACNGWASWASAGETLMTAVAAEVDDHDRLNGGGKKWELSRDRTTTLVRRLANLSAAETIYVVECIERFWRRHDEDTDVALANSGCVIQDDDN